MSTDNKYVLVALDFDSADKAIHFASQLSPQDCRLKVGKELFTVAGPELIKVLHGMGFDVFLDLKFHDIPNTVAKALAAAAELGVWMVNVHASGGRRMLEAARSAIPIDSDGPLLIAVSVLTSMDSEDLLSVGCDRSPEQQATLLASLAHDCGFEGVVCSAKEAAKLKTRFGPNFKLVTPGIRPQQSSAGDQKRVMTPADAIAAGSDYLVIGRPITQTSDPQKALRKILDSIYS